MFLDFCEKNEGIGDRAARRRKGYYKWQRRLAKHRSQHGYVGEYCPCRAPGKGQARFKDTPCHISEPKDAKIRPAAAARLSKGYHLTHDLRQVMPEVCTPRSPKKSTARKPNARQFPLRRISCWHCGVTIRTMTGPDPASSTRSIWGMDAAYTSRRENCARCIAIMNGLELPRVA